MMNEQAEWFQKLHDEFKDDPEYRLDGLKFEIGEEICKNLRITEMSRADLATKLGTSRAYITKILDGNTNFTLATLDRIAAALGCNLGIRLCPEGFSVPKLFVTSEILPHKNAQQWKDFEPAPNCSTAQCPKTETDDEINNAA